MVVSNYVDKLNEAGLLVSSNIVSDEEVLGVSYNSLKLEPGSIFVCKGIHFKKAYLEQAINKGAVAYISETDYEVENTNSIIVNDIRQAMVVLAKTYYGRLSDNIRLVGITGTKGKTSTIYYTKAILDEYEATKNCKPAGITSGIYNYDGITTEDADLTTPEIFEMYAYISNAVKSELDTFVIETSSQALKYDRMSGLELEVGVFINIGIDHISPSEHPSYEDYLASKLRIFDNCRSAVYNKDCDNQAEIRKAVEKLKRVASYSCIDESANVFAYDINSKHGQITFNVEIKGIEGYEDCRFTAVLNAFGLVNVENALAAIATAALVGAPIRCIQAGLEKIVVPGRMQVVRSKYDGICALVDYAHNKLSFEKVFETAREEFPEYKKIAVFGAAGNKAFNRREDLGRTSGKYADYTIVTEDDYGEEPIEKICNEISSFVAAEGGEYEIFYVRDDAVKRATDIAKKWYEERCEKTLVLLLGKGDETTSKRGSVRVPVICDAELFMQFMA